MKIIYKTRKLHNVITYLINVDNFIVLEFHSLNHTLLSECSFNFYVSPFAPLCVFVDVRVLYMRICVCTDGQ